jgi:hypothetical protein
MNGPPGRRFAGIHQHVDPSRVAVSKPELLCHCSDPPEIRSIDGYVDVSCEPAGIFLGIIDVQIYGEPADDTVLHTGLLQQSFHPIEQLEQLFHAFLEEGIDEH